MSDINGGSSEYPSTRSLTSQISEEEAILVSLDLVSAARRNLKFLRYVADSDWLHHLPTLLEAIRRSRSNSTLISVLISVSLYFEMV